MSAVNNLVRPTGVERRLERDEIIVSKTDPQGRITYVNDVFLEISRYEEEHLLGRPHNVIRHPEMPRAVFKLLWQQIQSGDEVFAYVNNLASDGANYWVLAHVTPSKVGGKLVGYHSMRRRPGTDAIDAVVPIYRALLEEEARHAHPVAALDASMSMLADVLASQRLTYDEFFWSITTEAA